MNRLLQILFWSVIAAAFVGPGTVTTCAKAGVRFDYALLWTVAFSTVACLVLQEASARVTIVSGRDLGQAIRERFHAGIGGLLVLLLVLGAIVLGCAAYQAGNFLGAAGGAALALPGSLTGWIEGAGWSAEALVTLLSSVAAALLLWFARTRTVATVLGLIVALMGISFLATAIVLRPPIGELVQGLVVPRVPEGVGLLVIGLIGTTVVPYNLFLGSGLAFGQHLREMRFGLSVAIVLGGIISMAILVVGTAVAGEFSFDALARALNERLGAWSGWLFALGLFCAGFSSAITAPLAAAVTARGLFDDRESPRWHERSIRYRAVWVGVLLTGAAFAAAATRPLQAIVVAQALNGIVLPFVAVFLMVVVNDRKLMGERVNRWRSNVLMGLVVLVTLGLGLSNVVKAVRTTLAALLS